jgi:hypothetical protein
MENGKLLGVMRDFVVSKVALKSKKNYFKVFSIIISII